MPKSKRSSNPTQPLTQARMEELLSGQSSVILEAVDERLAAQKVEIISAVNKQVDAVMKEI